jgi:hypothetical protein
MPYLHWEMKASHDAMTKVISSIDRTGPVDLSNDFGRDERLFRTHLSKGHLHIRRTLDQSYYWILADTTKRDNSQVVGRATRVAEEKLLMVDQLWMWILDGSK